MEVIDPRGQSGPRLLSFSLRKTELPVFVLTTASWMQWRFKSRIRYHARSHALAENATILSTPDGNRGYWNVEIAKGVQDKTTFISHPGLSGFIRMLFELENTPGTFQPAMDAPLSNIKCQFALVFLVDIIIFSATPDEDINHGRNVLTLLHELRVTFNLEKYKFTTNSIDYPGHVICTRRIKESTSTIDAMHGLKYPVSVTELRPLSRLCNVIHRFVPDTVYAAALLNKTFPKCQIQTFDRLSDDEMNALETLKAKLMKSPVLVLPRLQVAYTVEYGRLRQAYSMCPSAKAARWS